MADPYSKIIRDGRGNIRGSERDVPGYGSDVHDSHGDRVGSTTTFGTFDNQMNRRSDSDMPGFLIDESNE